MKIKINEFVKETLHNAHFHLSTPDYSLPKITRLCFWSDNTVHLKKLLSSLGCVFPRLPNECQGNGQSAVAISGIYRRLKMRVIKTEIK